MAGVGSVKWECAHIHDVTLLMHLVELGLLGVCTRILYANYPPSGELASYSVENRHHHYYGWCGG